MITLGFGKWHSASGIFFVRARIYWRGRWTPFCTIRKRYSSWLGFFQKEPDPTDI